MDQPQAARLLQEAVALQRRGRLDEAAALCERIVTAFPDVAEPLQLYGLVRMQQRRFAEAEQYLRRSAELAPRRAEFQSSLGNVLAAQDKTPEAEFVYQEALRLDNSFRPARLGLARLYNRVGMHSTAEDEARALLAGASDDARALNVLGTALKGQARLSDAEAAFRQALRLRPGYGAVRHSLGALLGDLHRNNEALEQFDAAIAAGVRGPRARTHRARALVCLDRREEALAALEGIVGEFPRSAGAQALLARLRHAAGDEDFARDLLAATEAHPTDGSLQLTCGTLLCGAGKTSEAIDVLQRALAAGGQAADLHTALARAFMDAGDYASALDAAEQACRTDPSDAMLKDRLIEALLSLGRADEALVLIDAARKRAPLDQWYIACEAIAARLLGDERYARLFDYERFVWTGDLPVPDGWSSLADFNSDLRAVLESRHRFEVSPLSRGLHHGTRITLSLIADDHPVIRAFRDAIDKPITVYRQQLGSADDHPLTRRNAGAAILSSAWSQRIAPAGSQRSRVRREGWLSAIYIAAAPDGAGEAGWLTVGEPDYATPGASVTQRIACHEGMLVILPSYMWHGMTPIAGAESRVTASFDIVTRA